MKKIFTTTLITLLLTLLTGVQLGMALTVDKKNPSAEVRKAFSAETLDAKDTKDEGLCSGIGDFKNKKCPPLVQNKSKSILQNDGQQEEKDVEVVVVEKPVYIPVEDDDEEEEEKENNGNAYGKEKNNNGRVLGVSTVRSPASTDAAEDASQSMLLLTVLMVLTLALTLISEIRTQKVIAQIQQQLHKKTQGGKRKKKK